MESRALTTNACRPENGVSDMISISDIDENILNINLKSRYVRDQIYTYTGAILVSVNPYKNLPIYEQENVSQYCGKKLNQEEPHIFAIAEAAYQNLHSEVINQSCIISGESGAGKTESTKFILQYLCSVTNHVSIWVEQQILEANTILEAFGNAKTVRNDNSSRFGKFMQVCFDDVSQIKGCIIQDYLLEQSRITFQSAQERNYHVFYQLLAAAKNIPEMKDQFSLGPPESYDYLNQSGCYTLDGVDDAQMFDNLRLAMNVLSIPAEMMDGIFSVLSAILLLGNMKFEDDDGERCHLTDTDSEIANTICCMLGLDFERFTEVCLYRQIQVRGAVTCIPYKVNEAIENKHAMAKALYSRTFAWLVDSINKCTNPGQHQTKFIGILDIFGFENFQTNSFEQFCINYTNEKLHKFFNHYVFALEQELYTEEGISFSHINFTDNTLCLELIEKAPKCILKILDEECRFPQGTDKSYIAKQHQALESHSYYVMVDPRLRETEFIIQHYAGTVNYTVEGFLNKNKDTQQDQLFDLMYNSNNTFVKDLTRFQDLLGVRLEDLGGRSTISRTSRGKPTVADTFKHQLSALVDVLGFTNPWYIRCLKPNVNKVADSYVDDDVLVQLRYSGMLDIIRIKKEGYPIHIDIDLFVEKYKCLLNLTAGDHDMLENREAILQLMNSLNLPVSDWQLGKSKMFLRNSVFEPLEERREVFIRRVTVLIQKVWRGYTKRKAYLRVRNAAITLQANFRVMRDRIAFLRSKRAAIVIQAYARGMLARRLANVERVKKRAEEERLREEEMERERQMREKEAENELAMEESIQESQAALESLTKTIESMWEKHHIDVTPSSLDLDEMFNFLDSQDGNQTSSTEGSDKEKALQLINQEFDDLDQLLENSTQILKEMAELDPELNGEDLILEDKDVPTKDEVIDIPAPPPLIPQAPPVPTELTNGSDFPPPPPPLPQSRLPANSPISEDNNFSYDATDTGSSSQSVIPIAPPLPSDLYQSAEAVENAVPVVIPPPPPHAPPSPPPIPPPLLPFSSIQNNGMVDNIEDVSFNSPLSPLSPILHVFSNSPSNPASGHILDTPPSVIPKVCDDSRERITSNTSTSFACPLSSTMDIEACDILEYAVDHFNEHVRGFTGSVMKSLKRKNLDVLKMEEMLQYNKSGAIPTSHLRLHDIENIQFACNIFKEMTKYIREELRPDTMIHIIQYVVKCGIERIELRDEIFCQLIRQTNQNPETEGLKRAWCLLCHCTAAFTPSKTLNKYLAYYMWQSCEVEEIGNYAKQCLKQLRTPKVMTRKYPPSATEIAALENLSPMVCRVYFMDGKTKAVSVIPCDTMAEVLEKVALKIGLKSVEGWAIYEVTTDYERFIRSYEYMADILSHWELQNRSFNTLSKYDTVSRKTGKSLGNNCEEARFVFRKRVYRHVHDIPNDPVEYHLLFSEAVHKVVMMDEFSVSEKVALQLAGLQARVVLGPYVEGKDSRYTDVNQYLCKRIASISNRNWPKEIMEAHKNYTSGKTELEAKVWYLTCVKQFPLYGCTLFSITHKGMWGHKGSTQLAINMDGIKFIKAKDKTVIHEFQYCDIETFAVDPNENYVSFQLKNDAFSRCPQRSFIFETNQKEDIGFLTASYSVAHTSWLKTDPDSLKKMKMSDDDKLRVYSELVSCRAALVESQCLKKPLQESGGMGLLRNTLRKLTKSKVEKLRRYSLGNLDGVFNLAYWSYNKTPAHQSLLTFHDPQEEEVAVRMYNSMLGVDGSSESGRIELANYMSQAQKIMQNCMENSQQCNEFYLQAIKQTTDNPEPESRLNQWYWQLMCVASSSVVPPNPLILNYLQTHLKKCSMDTKTEEGKYARFSHKCLNRNISKKTRKFPPSLAEIQYIFQRRYIKEKIYFVNGELRIIEFDSAATAEEIVKIIKTKLGMRSDAEGFALYEIMGTTEKTMAPEERMSDTISKWDRWAKGNYSSKELRILFKKRLFISPYLNINDPVECELVFHQLIEDVFEKRIPISETDATQLCALKLQSEIEDCPLEEVDYSSVMRILPREIRPCLSLDDIAAAHRDVSTLSPHEAILSFIDILKSWLFFGSTVFEVTQGYTTTMPKNLLLLINEAGLHVVHHKLSRVFGSYPHGDITCTSPSLHSIMIIIGQVAKGTKYVFNTAQASEISSLIKEYRQELKRKRSLSRNGQHSQNLSDKNGLSSSE